MALFQFLVQKLGLPVLAYFAITKALEAWKDQKLGKLVVIVLVAGFLYYFAESPETVLKATAPIWKFVATLFN
ncbi:TcpD family membrane protein [Falseniella ignava]